MAKVITTQDGREIPLTRISIIKQITNHVGDDFEPLFEGILRMIEDRQVLKEGLHRTIDVLDYMREMNAGNNAVEAQIDMLRSSIVSVLDEVE